jgi:hypothetical protein
MDDNDMTLLAVIFSGVVAISTIIYAYLTNRLVRETKLSRQFHLEAFIIAYLVNSETSPDIVSLVVKNIGNGVARNIKFRIIKDIQYPEGNPLSEIGIFSKSLDFFPPNYENNYILLSISEGHLEKMKDYVEFEITYDDAVSKGKRQNFKLEFKDILGLGKITPPGSYIGMISYRLEKIEKILTEKMK